jgi:hypothetical protein
MCVGDEYRERTSQEAGEHCIEQMSTVMNRVLHKLLLSDQIKENEMGGKCSMKESKEVCIYNFSLRTKRGKNSLETRDRCQS